MIQFILIGAFDEVYQKKYQGCKRKFSLADKIRWTLAVSVDKVFGIDDSLRKSISLAHILDSRFCADIKCF